MALESWQYGNPENFMDRQIAQSEKAKREESRKNKKQSRFTEEELMLIPRDWLKREESAR